MEYRQQALCSENQPMVDYMRRKWQELKERPRGLPDKTDGTIQKAYSNLCYHKFPIKTLKDLSEVKGVGKWILKQMKGFFTADSCDSGPDELPQEINSGDKARETKRYLPKRNSVAYALLITLYREMAKGSEYMHKQELIDAAEASGLSRAPIAPELGRGRMGQFGSSPREWYSGWSCMKTLINKGLVVKKSCPAKYKLTEAGRQAAHECLLRSNMVDPVGNTGTKEGFLDSDEQEVVDMAHASSDVEQDVVDVDHDLSDAGELAPIELGRNSFSNIGLECLQRCTRMGYSEEQTLHAFAEVSRSSPHEEMASLLPAVLCHLREDQIYDSHLESQSTRTRNRGQASTSQTFSDAFFAGQINSFTSGTGRMTFASLRSCTSSDHQVKSVGFERCKNVLRIPPLMIGEKFEDVYKVILILDSREHFARSKSRKIIENISSQFKIQIEVRQLPVGDGIWVARHKQLHTEYVLDFIVERKNVDDLRSSIRDNRYKDQKLRLLRTGLKKLLYVVEGDANTCEAADSIKTACLTTEVLEGFDVQRTSGLGDTLRKYGHLTLAISDRYKLQSSGDKHISEELCPTFDEFIKKCEELDKMTVGDLFAIQLMQVPQVTEEAAMAILDLYPTLYSLARAYSLLDGDIHAQEEMLRKETNNVVNSSASKNIFKLVWGR